MPSSLTRVRSSALVYSTYPPVSVSGTGVGALPRQAFRGRPGVRDSGVAEAVPSCSLLGHRHGGTMPPYQLERASSARSPSPPASRLGQTCNSNGAGISTCCPSPTPLGLGLGPTHPLRIDRAAETLDIRRWGFSPHESLLIPTFALVFAPHGLTLMLLCLTTLPYHATPKGRILRFGAMFSPATLSAPGPSTSELLRTLSRVAASKPTSWLSGRPHLLAHSTDTWGP